MGDGGGEHCIVWTEWRSAGWSVCLLLLIFPCTIKSRISLLAPAHPGGPGKKTVKRLWYYYYYLHWEGYFLSLFVCLFVSNFGQKLPNGFAWNFQEGWQWASEQNIKFLWRSASPSGYGDCFPDSSLLGDAESGERTSAAAPSRLFMPIRQMAGLISRYR